MAEIAVSMLVTSVNFRDSFGYGEVVIPAFGEVLHGLNHGVTLLPEN